MTISAMTRLVVEREQQEADAGVVLEKGEPSRGELQKQQEQFDRSTATALEKLAAFVPTEVITAYVAAVGVLVPTQSWHRWVIFVAATLALIILVWLDFALRDKRAYEKDKEHGLSPTPTSRRRILLAMTIAVVAFTVWAFAVPSGSPALEWGEEATRVFAVIAIGISAILYRVAQILDLAPVAPSK